MYPDFENEVRAVLTDVDRAKQVRAWRVEGHSWRGLALVAHETWGGTWKPPSNQIAGMSLCERAAQMLGEDAGADPWN